jgi:hypothetical protein
VEEVRRRRDDAGVRGRGVDGSLMLEKGGAYLDDGGEMSGTTRSRRNVKYYCTKKAEIWKSERQMQDVKTLQIQRLPLEAEKLR